jgi:stage II sporulation protein P
MRKIHRKKVNIVMMKGIIKTIAVSLLFALALYTFCSMALAEEEKEDGYFTVYEEGTNKKIFATSMIVSIGDQYLDEENNFYEVVKVSGDKAYARFKQKVDIERSLDYPEAKAMAAAAQEDYNTLKAAELKKDRVIAIYHTHSDESYIPTDGTSSIPYKGGIFKVGDSITAALERKGIKVTHSLKPHDPHDSMAYQRSRRTAMDLLKNGPDALVDVHRDAVPAEEYQGNVNGRPLAKVRLVVGRQNPQMSTINNFAWQLKANADRKYPGLVKGIFYGKGGYNQDLFPHSILIEAGTYTNSRYKAEDGADIMADVLATTIYGPDYQKKVTPGGGTTTQIPGEGGGAARALGWIVGIAIVGVGAYIFISTGGWNELSAKVRRFAGSEFANFLGNIRKIGSSSKKGKDSGENDNDNDINE